ncbi:MAG: YkgJ family cysteine cluster protein [Ilumatobacteraceae bacterium]
MSSDAPLDGPLPAGEFGAWLCEVQAAIRGEGATDVACGTCVACCSSSQFIHIAPDEIDALAHIPKALVFPAPRAPRGHVLMGYNEHGRCPMLRETGCSIYEHRPRTCRTYDCRVFPAAGVLPEGHDKAAIAATAGRWVFTYTTDEQLALHDAVRAAAAFMRSRTAELGEDAPHTTTQLAVAAVDVHALFNDATPTVDAVRVQLRHRSR